MRWYEIFEDEDMEYGHDGDNILHAKEVDKDIEEEELEELGRVVPKRLMRTMKPMNAP